MNSVEHIANFIKQISHCQRLKNNHCQTCQKKINTVLAPLIERNKPISFVLPAFPAKSSSRDKTLSSLPDLGETLALQRLETLCQDISSIYPPGARLVICADGHVFNDVVMVSDHDVLAYQLALRCIKKRLKLSHLSFFELEDAYQSKNYQTIRTKLVDEHGQSIEEVREKCIKERDEELLFCGLHRFLYEDLSCHYPALSNNKRKNIAKVKTYQTIQRSHAWSNLIKYLFPNHLRLSIHPHFCDSEKMSIKLFAEQKAWKTPWHNVLLKENGLNKLIKKKEAIAMGATLFKGNYPWENHYVLNNQMRRAA